MERYADLTPRPVGRAGVGPAGVGRIIVAVAVAAGLCFVVGLVQGAAWADAIRSVPEHALGAGLCMMCHGLGTAAGLLWLGCVLIVPVPAAVIGHSPSPRRRVGLAGLIGAVTAAALAGFALSTGIGGRYGFPEAEITFGIIAGLVSVSIAAVFGFGVGSLIRKRGTGSQLSTAERATLVTAGVVVTVVVVFGLLALVDAVFFG
jgi:hypothetical protein